MAATAAADWSQAPDDVLRGIAQRLPVVDYIRFRAVCATWRVALAGRHSPAAQVPSLMVRGDEEDIFRFLGLTEEEKEYRMSLPKIRNNYLPCIGSSEGFLIYRDNKTKRIKHRELHMLDPISGAHVDLPSLATLPDPETGYQYFRKVILSPGSTKESYTAVFIHCYPYSYPDSDPDSVEHDQLAFARAGDKAWTLIEAGDGGGGGGGFHDVIFHQGLLYALYGGGHVFYFDLNDPSVPGGTYLGTPGYHQKRDSYNWHILYLVVLSGELFQVWRDMSFVFNPPMFVTAGVLLFKMDCNTQQWVAVESIGDQALFLGHNSSVSFSTRDFPQLKPNCIYFTANNIELVDADTCIEWLDLGVYNIEDGSMDRNYPLDSNQIWPSPVWFSPTMRNLPDAKGDQRVARSSI